MIRTDNTVGWDVGGVNTKVALVTDGVAAAVRSRPYEIQRDPDALTSLLVALAREVAHTPVDAHAVTMTAELSQLFRTKRAGVACVLDAFEAAFPRTPIRVYTTAGTFVDPDTARQAPLTVAAANWVATGMLIGRTIPDAILIDIGTTTTDIVPIIHGTVAALGRTDPDRLRSGELVYLGAVRTPVEAIVHGVPLEGAPTGVSAEGFALAGDVHLWRGTLASADYASPTPDGRPATREYAGERLARIVCADREMLDDAAIDAIADAVAEAQRSRTTYAIERVRTRYPAIDTAVVAGVGDFIAVEAAARAGLTVRHLAGVLGADAARCAPAAAVAHLLATTELAAATK